MPINKVKSGYRFGTKGKIYSSRQGAIKQMRAIKANQSKKK